MLDLRDITPKFFSMLKQGISPRQIKDDIISGIIVGIVALPLAIAFAIASGVSPEKGIVTAIVAGFLISFLGGSRVQIGGPTGAFVVIIVSIVTAHGIDGLLIATFLAGIILILMGLFRMGSLLKYIPQTLIIGFTTGIAVIIFSIQIKDLLGLNIDNVPSQFISKWKAYFVNINTLNPWAAGIGILTILMLLFLPRISKKVPWTFIVLTLWTVAVAVLHIPVETIKDGFGTIPAGFQFPDLTAFSLSEVPSLLSPAFTIAILAALESLLSAIVSDSMIGSKHRSNAELIAQGVANIVSAVFGGIPATGAIARTATNVNQGGRTPIAGMTHSLVLLIIFLAAMPVVSYIPLSVLAGILIVVAWKMSELHVFINNLKINIFETLVLLTTFFLTVLLDLTIAIPVGLVLSVFLFMKRMSDSVEINPIMTSRPDDEKLFSEEIGEVPDHIQIFELNGPLFFASIHSLLTILPLLQKHHRYLVLRFRYVPIVDTSGLTRLKEFVHDMSRRNITVIMTGVQPKVKIKLEKLNVIDTENIYSDLPTAWKSIMNE